MLARSLDSLEMLISGSGLFAGYGTKSEDFGFQCLYHWTKAKRRNNIWLCHGAFVCEFAL